MQDFLIIKYNILIFLSMNILLLLIYIILIFDFLLERILSVLNSAKRNRNIPLELKDVYDEATFQKSQDYKREYERFGILTASFSFLIMLSMLTFQGFAYTDGIVRGITENLILVSLTFFGLLFLASDLIGIPFELYVTFVIEEKYGFNKTTPKLYITDKLKGYFLGALIGGGLLTLFIWFYYSIGKDFWVYIWLIFTAFSIFMSMFYSNVIVPLFNKQTPLEEGELRLAITEFAVSAGFQLKNIYVIDGSKRSTKANAYFTGLGPKKRIVLYDNLIKQLSIQEIVAVLAHEVGHYKKKHTISGLITSVIQTGLTLYILSLFISSPALSAALGVTKPGIHISLIAFGILYSPISTILGLGMNVISRINEYAADKYAASFGLADELISGLKKLSHNTLSNLNPHPAYVFFHYSHPTLLQRIRALNKITG
jgi:STE24 endopeptidase